ncbi:MAG: dephospho-CoA kinase [Gammaproteobacteria bacterium]
MSQFWIGLTGGVGSGKSTVCGLFKALGIDVISADDIVKQLTQPQTALWQAIVEHFQTQGLHILLDNQNLNKQALSQIIFNDPIEKSWLENLLHPKVYEKIIDFLKKSSSPYALAEIPLLLENKRENNFHRILVTDCSLETQIERVKKRGLNEALILKMIQSQVSRQDRLKATHDILNTEFGLNALEIEVKKLHRLYLNYLEKIPLACVGSALKTDPTSSI